MPGLSKAMMGLLLCAGSASAHSRSLLEECGTPSKTIDAACPAQRIVGGTETTPREFGFMVSLRDFAGQHMCGGSVVAPGWVLTAAHCLTQPGHTAVIGAHDIGEEESCAEHIRIKTVYKHKDYNTQNMQNDIVLLELETDTVYPPVALDFDGTNSAVKTDVTVIGWGTTSFMGQLSDQLLKVNVKVTSNQQCNQNYEGMVTDSMICATVSEGGKDACQGDSGGPLFAAGAKGTPVQVGVVSWGEDCAKKGYHGVYTRVSSYADWINDVMAGKTNKVEVNDKCTGEDPDFYDGYGDFALGDFDFGDFDFGDFDFGDFDFGFDYGDSDLGADDNTDNTDVDGNTDVDSNNDGNLDAWLEWADVDMNCMGYNKKRKCKKKSNGLCRWRKKTGWCEAKQKEPELRSHDARDAIFKRGLRRAREAQLRVQQNSGAQLHGFIASFSG